MASGMPSASPSASVARIFLRLKNNAVISAKLADFSFSNQANLSKKITFLKQLNSKKQFSKGIVHTNTIEGFWAIVKNSIRGNYIALSKKYLPFYLVQAQYIFNRRNAKHDVFEEFMAQAVKVDKSDFVNLYKPKKDVRTLVYNPKNRVKCS